MQIFYNFNFPYRGKGNNKISKQKAKFNNDL